MAQPFSEETQELLERAQRAINRSIELRDQTRSAIREAQFTVLKLQATMNEQLTYKGKK